MPAPNQQRSRKQPKPQYYRVTRLEDRFIRLDQFVEPMSLVDEELPYCEVLLILDNSIECSPRPAFRRCRKSCNHEDHPNNDPSARLLFQRTVINQFVRGDNDRKSRTHLLGVERCLEQNAK